MRALVLALLALAACAQSRRDVTLVVSGCRGADPAYVRCTDGGRE